MYPNANPTIRRRDIDFQQIFLKNQNNIESMSNKRNQGMTHMPYILTNPMTIKRRDIASLNI